MNWQEWVVGLLIVLCVARILYGIYLFFRHSEDRAFARRCGFGTESGEFIPGPRHFRGRIYKGTDRSGKKGRVLSVHAGDFVRCDHR